MDLNLVPIKSPAVGGSERSGDLRLGVDLGACLPSGSPPLWSGWTSRGIYPREVGRSLYRIHLKRRTYRSLDLKCKAQSSAPIHEQEIDTLTYNWSAPEAEDDGNDT